MENFDKYETLIAGLNIEEVARFVAKEKGWGEGWAIVLDEIENSSEVLQHWFKTDLARIYLELKGREDELPKDEFMNLDDKTIKDTYKKVNGSWEYAGDGIYDKGGNFMGLLTKKKEEVKVEPYRNIKTLVRQPEYPRRTTMGRY